MRRCGADPRSASSRLRDSCREHNASGGDWSYSAKQPSEPEAERQRRYVYHHEEPHEIKALPGFAGFRRVSHPSLGTHLPVKQHMRYRHHLGWHHLDHVE
jgi:hypothetical protein